MVTILTAVSCFAMLISTGLRDHAMQAASARDRADLERLETVWNAAHERGDAEVLDSLWADELVVTVPGMPTMGKKDSLAIWRSGRMKFTRYATSDLDVRVLGDAAVVTGRLLRQRIAGGRQLADDWRFTKVYLRRDGRWQVVSFHASNTNS